MDLNLKNPLVVFDLETTGIHVTKDRIVEISMLKITADGSRHDYTRRINPKKPISPEASKVHGITDEMVKNEPPFEKVAQEIHAFIGGSDLAGYNLLKFDIPILVESFLRCDMDFDIAQRRIIDVQNIFHKMEQRTLKAAYRFYCNKELTDAHSAKADTQATLEVLESMLDKYQGANYEDSKGNISQPVVNDVDALHTFSHYKKHADLVGQIVYDNEGKEVFNFGKHKGKPVEEVFEREPQYYDWMMKADFPESTRKLITTIKLRGFNKDSVNIMRK